MTDDIGWQKKVSLHFLLKLPLAQEWWQMPDTGSLPSLCEKRKQTLEIRQLLTSVLSHCKKSF